MSTRFILLALAAALAVPPAATAGWAGKGGFEPSTGFDDDGYMFLNPDNVNDGGRRVYFSGFAGAATLVAVTSVNPNFGNPALETSVIMPVEFNAQALLGVWKDCNNDGYIGFGDNALFEYRSVLLTLPGAPGETICPKQPLPNPMPFHQGVMIHNDGDWVREFIPIGPESIKTSLAGDSNPYNIPDNGARVWADWGVPGSPPGYICYLLTHPTGSFDTVGNMIGLADCFARQRIDSTLTSATSATPTTAGAYATAKATKNPWGQPEDGSAAYVGDCSSMLVQPTKVPNTQHSVAVPRPNPRAGSGASVGGTLNETSNTFSDCDRTNGSPASVDSVPYSTTDEINNQYGRKTVNEWVLKFTEDVRPGPTSTVTNQLGRGTNKDLGTRPLPEGFWRANAVNVAGHNPVLNIDSIQPQPVQYITYYAFVSGTTTSALALRFPGTTGTYGTEACGSGIGPGQPDRNFWACDPNAWWPTDLQSDPIAQGIVDGESAFVGVRIGQAYQLRDVDCYDTSAKPLRDNGVYYPIGLGNPCA